MINVGIIGAGGWGSSIAKLLSENGHKVCLWTHEADVIDEISLNHTNSHYLANVFLPENIKVTNNPAIISEKDVIINTVPTQFIREVYTKNDFNVNSKPLINGSKGIEKSSLMRISEIFVDVLNIDMDNYAVFSGPSHAEEVALNVPTTIVAASENSELVRLSQKIFTSETFRVYASDDVVGCEIGGALKNVIAIAAGTVDGLNFGDNTKAALITRGLAEIARLGVALGSKSMTFSGLSGLGDLIVTCNSKHSRNRSVGELIGRGMKIDEIIKKTKKIAEGLATTKSTWKLSQKHSVEMPITEQMFDIIYNDKSPKLALSDLMNRSSKREWWW